MSKYNEFLKQYMNANKNEWEIARDNADKLLQICLKYQTDSLEMVTRNLSKELNESALKMSQTSVKILKDTKYYNNLLENFRSVLYSNIDYTLISENWKTFLIETYKKKIDFSANYSKIYSYYIKVLSDIQSMPEVEIETILDGTEYTRADVVHDIEHFTEDLTNAPVADNMLPEEKVEAHMRKYPALAYIIFMINMILFVISSGQMLDDTIVPWFQNAIVSLQGCEDIFFIKVDSAKLYTEPSSHSEVIRKILYAEQVTQIESVKLWDKVIYINSDGDEIEGWIAKRNLMTYQDYEFNSDNLYDE